MSEKPEGTETDPLSSSAALPALRTNTVRVAGAPSVVCPKSTRPVPSATSAPPTHTCTSGPAAAGPSGVSRNACPFDIDPTIRPDLLIARPAVSVTAVPGGTSVLRSFATPPSYRYARPSALPTTWPASLTSHAQFCNPRTGSVASVAPSYDSDLAITAAPYPVLT